MALFITEKSQPRSFVWLWALHLVAFIFTISVLAVTARLVASLTGIEIDDYHCGSSAKINFNLAVAVISFIFLIFPIFSTGPHPSSRIIPWSIYVQLGLDSLLFVFWIASAATSPVTCADLCSACSSIPTNIDVYLDSKACSCYYYYKRDTSPNPQNQLLGKRRTYSYGHYSSGSSIAAREALDAILTVLFAVCIGGSIWYIIQQRKSTSAYNPESNVQSSPMAPIKYEEPGKAPPVVVAPAYPQQEQPTYNPNQMPAQPQPSFGGQQPTYQQQQAPTSGPPLQQWTSPSQQSRPEQSPPGSQPYQGVTQQYYIVQPGAGNPRAVSEMRSPGPDNVTRNAGSQ